MLWIRDLKFYTGVSFVALIPMKIHINLTKSCPLSISFGIGVPEAQSSLAAPLLADPLGSTHHPFEAGGLQTAICDPAPGRRVAQRLSSAASVSKVTSCCPLPSLRGKKEVTRHECGG